jgi:hypothetical protein
VTTVTPDKRSAWLQKFDAECPYQITLPRRQLTDDSATTSKTNVSGGKWPFEAREKWMVASSKRMVAAKSSAERNARNSGIIGFGCYRET